MGWQHKNPDCPAGVPGPPAPPERLGRTSALLWQSVSRKSGGELRLQVSASTGMMFDTASRGKGVTLMKIDFHWYVGIDWGSQKHRVCCLNADGEIKEERWIEHSGEGLRQLVEGLQQLGGGEVGGVAVGIEITHGAVVETLLENGFAVFSINPKQLDRFRDRYSPAGAKDDKRDALVLADSLRTDRHCFHAVRLGDSLTIRLRELSRLEEQLTEEQNRLSNRLWNQLQRYFPSLLQLSPSAAEPWLWDLLEAAPLPAKAAKLSATRIRRILDRHRIRRLDAAKVQSVLAAPPLTLARGAAEAASEHALLLLPQLRLVDQQRKVLAKRIAALLEELSEPETSGGAREHRDAAILRSLPGVGRKVAATMLSEALQAIAERDYHALRCLAGVAPVTRQTGKKTVVQMRYACNERLRDALYYWSLSSSQCDPKTQPLYPPH